jgi:uncharacterized membrane protein YbhN (UPF0104 family)
MTDWLSNNRLFLLRLLGTLLAIALLTILLRGKNWAEMVAVLDQVSRVQVVLAALLVLASRLFVIARWYILLRSGGVGISLSEASALTFTGLFANSFLPTTIGGDVIRLAGAMQMGFDRAVCLASIAADRLIGMLGMFFALPLGLVPAWRELAHGAAASVALPSFLAGLGDFFKRTLHTFSIWIRQPVALAAALGCSFGHMACTFGALYVLIHALGGHVSFWLIGGLWSMNYFVTLVPISVNGYGVQELSLTFLFSAVGGLSAALSAALAILIRALYLLASLPGVLFLPNILAVMGRERDSKRGRP